MPLIPCKIPAFLHVCGWNSYYLYYTGEWRLRETQSWSLAQERTEDKSKVLEMRKRQPQPSFHVIREGSQAPLAGTQLFPWLPQFLNMVQKSKKATCRFQTRRSTKTWVLSTLCIACPNATQFQKSKMQSLEQGWQEAKKHTQLNSSTMSWEPSHGSTMF